MISRAKYGYGYNDEPFILTLAHRLLKGDALLCDEWHPTQLTGYLNYFITKVYFMFHSSTEGMILNFRYIYVVLWTLTILVIYRRISKYTKKPIITCFACLYLLLFSSMDIMTLSYNFYSLAGVMLCYTFVVTGNKKWEYFLSGIFYSIATLASPYLSIVFILYYIGYGIYKWILKKEINNKWKEVTLYLLYGVLVSVVLFVIFFFRHGGSIDKAIKSLHFILNDSEYPSRSIITLIFGYIKNICVKFRVYGFILCVFLILSFLDKKRKEFYFNMHLVTFVLLMPLLIYMYRNAFNYMIVQMTFLGFHAIVLKNKDVNRSYLGLYFIGILFSFVLNATSDLGIISIAMGFVVSGFASFFLIEESIVFKNIKRKKILIGFVCIAQISSQCYLRCNRYYHNRNLKNNIYIIDRSVAKGLYVTKEICNDYNNVLEDIRSNIPTHSNICILSIKPWLFLENDGEYGTYSTWSVGTAEYKIERLKFYYELNADKYPDYVYVLKEDYDDRYLNEVFIDYKVMETGLGFVLVK